MRRTMIPFVTLAVTLASLCPILAQPSGSGSISSGHQIAVTICGNCHEDPTSSRKTAVGPKLEDIANRPSTTALFKGVSWFTPQAYAELYYIQG